MSRVNKGDPNDPEKSLQYKYRGIYESERLTPARLLLVGGRVFSQLVCYSLLVDRSSPWSFFGAFPSIAPSTTPMLGAATIPLLSNDLLLRAGRAIDMTSIPNLIIFGMMACEAFVFTSYSLLWRREWLPMTGDGSSIGMTSMLSIIDLIQTLIYVYTAGRNPTWVPEIFAATVWPMLAGVALQWGSDAIKQVFKSDPKNEGKVLDTFPWSVVRAPNFAGFHFWRWMQFVAHFGYIGGTVMGAMLLPGTYQNSLPSIERHMGKKYGDKYEKYKREVKWKLCPGIY